MAEHRRTAIVGQRRQAECMRLGDYLMRPSGSLNELATHAHFLRSLELGLRAQLPTPLNQHVGVANVRGETVVLYATSPEWLTRLRFALPAIRKCLTRCLKSKTAAKVEIRIALPADYGVSRSRPRRRLSSYASSFLQALARDTPDPSLRARFLALSRSDVPYDKS